MSDLQSNTKSEKRFQSWDHAEISVFGFSFLTFNWEIQNRIKNSGLERPHIINKKNPVLQENSSTNPFSDFPIENPWNADLNFLIEIHHKDGFLRGEIRFRISRSIAKSGIRISKSKSGFPNQMQPTWSVSYTKILLMTF